MNQLNDLRQEQNKNEPRNIKSGVEYGQKKANLVRPRHKFAPFTRAERKERRDEVYKLHFEYGIPAIRISEMMKVDRNTINNDLKIPYNKAVRAYNPDMTLDDIIEKQLLGLETQRDRLCLYLCDAKDTNSKLTIERLITDIDFKVIGVIKKNGSKYSPALECSYGTSQ